MDPKLAYYIQEIAKAYDARVQFRGGFDGGLYDLDGLITISTTHSYERTVSVFCHELAHHVQTICGIFPDFHCPGFILNPDPRLALDAEIYTEKMGKQLCNFWFPEVRYLGWYKNTEYHLGFVHGYYSAYA